MPWGTSVDRNRRGVNGKIAAGRQNGSQRGRGSSRLADPIVPPGRPESGISLTRPAFRTIMMSREEGAMKYRILGKTGLHVSVIGLGTWQMGGEWGIDFTQAMVTSILAKALELGINFIDTAECYGDHLAERLIGQGLADLGARGKFIVATKFGHHFERNFERTEPRSGPEVQQQLEDSLRALQTDYIDLYQYHSWRDEEFASDEVRKVLEQARVAGKIRHIGNSLSGKTRGPEQLEKSKAYHVEAAQIVYNRLQRQAEDHLFPVAERLHVGVLARVPLASGLLTGKYDVGARFPANDVRAVWQAEGMDERLAEVRKIASSEVPAGVPMARWALAWCLHSPAVQCVIPGCKTLAQVEDNARAADLADAKHPWAVK
jgi:myo-inositol catabolism protein IolS